MPRNGSGTYTLPEAAFVPNTVISSNAVNTDFSDIATALTDSLAADGQTSITGAMKGVNGSLGSPSWTFNNDTATGAYLAAASELGLVAGGLGVLIDGVGFAASGAPAISAAGSGYAVGDQITLTGGTFTNPVVVQVATLSGSGVATVTLVEAGRYSTKPSNPVAQGSTTGTGTGATFTVSWSGALALTDLSGGQLWSALGATAFAKNQILLANSVAQFLGSAGVTAYNLATSAISPNVTMVNGTLVQSQAGGAQTFAVKTLAGTDATATNPIYFVFRDVTAGTGDFTVRSVTAALNVTIPAGGGTNTMGFTSSTPARIWVGALDNTSGGGGVELFVVNALTAASTSTVIYPLRGWGIISTSAVASATAARVAYSTAARTSKPYVTLGYASWEAPATMTAGAWNVAPTRLNIYQSGVTPLPGQEIQRQRTTTGTVATGTTVVSSWGANTTPTNAMGDEYMTQAITPTSSANVLEIETNGYFNTGTGTSRAGSILCQDATVNCLTAEYVHCGASNNIVSRILHSMLAATLSSTTFRLRFGGGTAGTNTFNGEGGSGVLNGTYNSYIQVKEIMA